MFGQSGAAAGVDFERVALTKWYAAGQSNNTVKVGTNPQSVAFDGAHIWVASANSMVTKLRADDGSIQGVYTAGSTLSGIALDGANVWVTSSGDNTVVKLRPADGAVQGTFSVGKFPRGLAFDGANIWVANYLANTVTKLRAADGVSASLWPARTRQPALARRFRRGLP